MTEASAPALAGHSITVSARTHTVIEGVAEVISCDGELLTVELADCRLAVRGSELRIGSFDHAKGRLLLDGSVAAVEYIGGRVRGGSLIDRIFR